MKKVTLLGFICLAVILAVMSFAACAQQAAAPTTTVTAPAATVTAPAGTVTAPARTTTAPAVTVTATPPAAQAKEPTYTVLDPRSYELPVKFVGLGPRLDTLDGKKVGVVNFHGGNEESIQSIAPALQKAVPNCKVVLWETEVWAQAGEEDWKFIESCNAVIIGNDY